MWAIPDKCTPASIFEKESSVGVNAFADSLKIPIVVYRPSEHFVRVKRAKAKKKDLSIHVHSQRAIMKHHRKPISLNLRTARWTLAMIRLVQDEFGSFSLRPL